MSTTLETDIYEDLYGDSENVDNKDSIPPTQPEQEEDASPEPPEHETRIATGENSLPPKPTQSSELSYSAQIAKQFSAYKQTPAQERQQRSFTHSSTKLLPSSIDTIDGNAQDGASMARRPVRPSEMKDEG
ncbi:hypothetical protein SCP_1003810 [Sparassis crispa]|uniref:Uncharacterized protein n=1 Tax=Sparassis crispa TaxID=139825 RepID=A0A401GYJ0_9APHY|nr:hypothetical protein SCP_1003810 [Sparassis crispa]GBE87134.1 hypothetical protein SCP_1003810 [Sparassis crispa]